MTNPTHRLRHLLCAALLLSAGCAGLAPPPAATTDATPVARLPAPVAQRAALEAYSRLQARYAPSPAPAPRPAARDPRPLFQGPPAAYLDPADVALVERSLWNRLRDGFALEPAAHPAIERELRWFAANPAYLGRVAERAQPFLHHIAEQLEARGMPGELALLPIVESAFNVFAYSPGRAAGLWQFIPATGRRYGLKQNWWYDGRRDVVAATDAALDYLSDLQERFAGDWLHALAAYNSGSGTVSRAIRRNQRRGRPTDFWHLDLPAETRGYVPKLLALRALLADPGRYGISLPEIPDEPVITSVATGGQLDLALAAELAGISLEDLYRLNPGFNRWATDPDGPHHLVVPLQQAEALRSALQGLAPERRVSWHRHRVRSGETLSHISKRYGVTVAQLKSVNSLRGSTIRAGKHLLIPKRSRAAQDYSLSLTQRQKALRERKREGERVIHRVRSGDTLWDLARRYGVGHRRLASWNGLAPRDLIRPGQELVVWVRKPAGAPRPPAAPSEIPALAPDQAVQRIRYVVRRGDSLARIASRFKVSISDLKRWNRSTLRGKYLQPGQRLQLYVDLRRQSG